MSTEIATFAAGCFWGVESKFRLHPGVEDTQVGYTGGDVENPSYKQVCRGRTGHAEAVEIRYDPEITSYQHLVEAFFEMHNPTSKNRQGLDIGSQYRSAIFTHSDEQAAIARSCAGEYQSQLGKKFLAKKVVTEITPATEFWPAEEYHQCYIEK